MKKIIVITAILACCSFFAKAQVMLEFYNNTNKDVFASYAYFDVSNNYWVSKGWYKVEKYSTTTVDLGPQRSLVYVHGETIGLLQDKLWGSGFNFCVDMKGPFEIRYADKVNCGKPKAFSQMSVKQGTNKWTFNP